MVGIQTMKIRGCNTSPFILTTQDCMVKKVHNTDINGRLAVKLKKLEEIYESADAEYTSKFQDDYAGKFSGSGVKVDYTPLPFAERKTQARSSYVVEEDEPEFASCENNFEELTLSQLKKECKRKKRKASESVILTPKVDDDDSDLDEPLSKIRVKVLKSIKLKTMPAARSLSTTSGSTLLVTSELCAGSDGALLFSKDLATVKVKVETPEGENFECTEMTFLADDPLNCNEPMNFIASGPDSIFESMKSGSFTSEEEIGLSKVSLDNLVETKNTFIVPPMGEEHKELDNEQNIVNGLPLPVSEVDKEDYVNQNHPPLNASFLEDNSSVEYLMAGTSCSQSHPYLQQAHEQVNYILHAQGPDLTFNDDPNSLNSSVLSEDTPILQGHPSFVPADDDLEVLLSDHNNQTDTKRETSEFRNSHCIELRHPERLSSTRKVISPTSQEKLCLAMKSADLLDDMDHYKCKEKLYFQEQAENKFASTISDVGDTEPNVHPQKATQLIQKKVVISPKDLLRRAKNYKKGSPPKKCDEPKCGLDEPEPRLCRSLPRLSTGCTSIQGCSESAIAFSQRQMHDIESLALKLMNELNSIKAIAGEKMQAHCSTSLKNESDEVNSAIKSATKTEEAARKWLSMMARDCNRFCKIMKLKEGSNTSGSDHALGSTNQEKSLQKEQRKKISFADEAGGTLCDIKLFQTSVTSFEPL